MVAANASLVEWIIGATKLVADCSTTAIATDFPPAFSNRMDATLAFRFVATIFRMCLDDFALVFNKLFLFSSMPC